MKQWCLRVARIGMTTVFGVYCISKNGTQIMARYITVSIVCPVQYLLQQTCFSIILPCNNRQKQDFFVHGQCTGFWTCLTRFLIANQERVLFKRPGFEKEWMR